MNKLLLLFGLALCFSPLYLPAQNVYQQRLEAMLEEKVHITDWQLWQEQQLLLRYPDQHTSTQWVSGIRSIQQEQRIGVTQKIESELHSAINPADTNNLVIATMRLDPTNPLNSLSFTVYSTQDFGQNWFESTFTGAHPASESIVGGGDPVLAFTSDGTLHLTWLLVTVNPMTFSGTMGIYHAISNDNGVSWTAQPNPIASGDITISLSGGISIQATRLVDKQWMAVDRTGMISHDNVYVAYFDFQLSPDTIPTIQCLRKTSNQLTFSSPAVQVNTANFADLQFASITVDQGGTVHISFWGSFDREEYALYHAWSDDEGSTFYPETKIADMGFPAPDSSGGFPPSNIVGVDRLYPCPHIYADATSGPFSNNLYAMWTARGTDTLSTEGYDIYYTRSADGGQTWDTAAPLNDDSNPDTHQFFPSLYVNDQGVLVASWYDRRDDTANVNTHYYLSWSNNGGQSFEPQIPVSTIASDFSQIGTLNDGFGVGEYTQIVATNGYAIPVWADGRENNGRVTVHAAWVPLNGPATSIEDPIELSPGFTLLNWQQQGQHLTLEWEQAFVGDVNFGLYSLDGRHVLRHRIHTYQEGKQRGQLLLPAISGGVYILEIQHENVLYRRQIVLLP